MKTKSSIFSLFIVATLSLNVHAASHSKICSNSEGNVSVLDGEVTIKDGIGNVGPVKKSVLLKRILESHEQCVDGPNYVSTFITVEKVTYDIEENITETAIVLCTQTLTGIVPPGTKCKL